MLVTVTLFSLVAIATGSIPISNSNTTTPTKRSPSQTPACQLINPEEGAQLDFTSTQRTPVTVVFSRFIEINCSAQNFCNITWLKDGSSPYPFGLDMSIELRHDKQVLELQKAYYTRAGNYTCLATDGTVTINRTVEVIVTADPWVHPPLPLQIDTCTDQTSAIGTTATFFCIFYAGEKVYDVNVVWYKKMEVPSGDSEWVPVDRLSSKQTKYKEDVDYSERRDYSGSGKSVPTAGKRLYIKNIGPDAYGDYRLTATLNGKVRSTYPLSLSASPKADMTAVIAGSLSLMFLVLVIVTVVVTWHFKKLDIKIWMKNRYGTLEEDDGKTYDVFISYADEELPFVLTIRQTLHQAGYNVCVRDIDISAATTLVEEMIIALKDSRRCLIIISPDFLTAPHSSLQVEVAFDLLMQKQIRILPIIYRDISTNVEEMIPRLNRILTNVRHVQWDETNEEEFSKELLVLMPPRGRQRPTQLTRGCYLGMCQPRMYPLVLSYPMVLRMPMLEIKV